MDPRIRASDADRDRVVETMGAQVGPGRLTLDEFSERSAQAYRARTVGDLAQLTRDLPAASTTAATQVRRPLLTPLTIMIAALLVGMTLLLLVGAVAADSMGSMMGHMSTMMGR